jgi:DNA-binding MarR family transcriptional regulator
MSLLHPIKDVEMAARARLDEVVRPVGLSAHQYLVLTVLERSPGRTTAQLAERSFVTHQSMTDTINTLCGMRLVGRQRDVQDRRAWRLHLTAAGVELVARARPGVEDLERRILANMGEVATEDLEHVLLACARAFAIASDDLA